MHVTTRANSQVIVIIYDVFALIAKSIASMDVAFAIVVLFHLVEMFDKEL